MLKNEPHGGIRRRESKDEGTTTTRNKKSLYSNSKLLRRRISTFVYSAFWFWRCIAFFLLLLPLLCCQPFPCWHDHPSPPPLTPSESFLRSKDKVKVRPRTFRLRMRFRFLVVLISPLPLALLLPLPLSSSLEIWKPSNEAKIFGSLPHPSAGVAFFVLPLLHFLKAVFFCKQTESNGILLFSALFDFVLLLKCCYYCYVRFVPATRP